MAETDPKSVQDLTNVVQTLLQQMQDKFQTMSDQIIGRNILTLKTNYLCLANLRASFVSSKVSCFLTGSPLDEMSTRIDDLEKNIADLMTQAGVEEIEAAPEKAKEGGQGS
ncbi:uncharacterized protein V6R79_001957 [Siganus canaliculatus]